MCESDFCVCSPTGTGKTLAYLIPVVDAMESLQGSLLGQPKVLVLAPTKDLGKADFLDIIIFDPPFF